MYTCRCCGHEKQSGDSCGVPVILEGLPLRVSVTFALSVIAAIIASDILHLDDHLIGLTIIALGTSLPELMTSVTAALADVE